MSDLFSSLSVNAEFLPKMHHTGDIISAIADGFAPIERRNVRVRRIWMTREIFKETFNALRAREENTLWGAEIHLWDRNEIFLFGDSHEGEGTEDEELKTYGLQEIPILESILGEVPKNPASSLLAGQPKRTRLMQEVCWTPDPHSGQKSRKGVQKGG